MESSFKTNTQPTHPPKTRNANLQMSNPKKPALATLKGVIFDAGAPVLQSSPALNAEYKAGGTMTKPTSFQADIRPLFTDRDIEGMKKGFNLASYDEVKAHAAAIYDRIRGIGGAVMPPPPPRGEGPWPQANIDLFAKWMADGYQP
jgi:hypothetical protein